MDGEDFRQVNFKPAGNSVQQAAECERIIDQRAVVIFATAMSAKLDKKRAEGRSGWHDSSQCSIDELRILFRDHLSKGDMVDIANLAMMIWHRERLPVTNGRKT